MTADTEAPAVAAEKPAPTPKVKLSPEERKTRVQDARESRVKAAFENEKLEVIGVVDGPEKYTDVTGNKGRKGYVLKYLGTTERAGSTITVGPGSLKKAIELGAVDKEQADSVTKPPKPPKEAPAAPVDEVVIPDLS